MIIDTAINKFIENTLVEENAKREKLHEPSGKLSAGMLFQPVRFQVMKTLGIPRREIEPYVLGKFARGNQAEEWYVSQLEKMGCVVEKQKPVEYRDVIGLVDAYLDTKEMQFKHGLIPHEVKSVTNAKLKRISTQGVDWHYKLQAGLYALALKSDYFAVDIVSAEDLRVNVYIFQTSEVAGEINKIIDLYESAMNAWDDTGMLPALTENPLVKWATDPKYAAYDPLVWTDEAVIKYLKEAKA